MTVLGTPPPPKVERRGSTLRVEWCDGHATAISYHNDDTAVGVALLELIERREADFLGVAVYPAPEPIEETPVRALVGYMNDARADIADAVARCATNDAAEALTQALAYMNAVVRLCGIAAVRDAS